MLTVVLVYDSADPAMVVQEVVGVLGGQCVVKIAAGKTRTAVLGRPRPEPCPQALGRPRPEACPRVLDCCCFLLASFQPQCPECGRNAAKCACLELVLGVVRLIALHCRHQLPVCKAKELVSSVLWLRAATSSSGGQALPAWIRRERVQDLHRAVAAAVNGRKYIRRRPDSRVFA
jgi:hypothetical protein